MALGIWARLGRGGADAGARHAGPWARVAGRVVLWAVIVVVLVRGLGVIVAGPTQDRATGHRTEAATFPDGEARAFAVRFVRSYLDVTPGGGDAYRRAVAAFFADGLSDRAAVVPPRGPGVRVAWAMVAREVSLGGSRALVTVAALVRDGSSRYVTVPVARDRRGGLAVAGLPSFSPPPARAAVDVEDVEPLAGAGAEAIGDLARRFLREYLAGADRAALAYFLVPGAAVAAMPPGLRVVAVDALDQATPGSVGRRRLVVASVRVRESSTGAVYPLAYRLEVVKRGRWHVAEVAGGPGA